MSKYKFQHWEKHGSTGEQVTEKEKVARAYEIADILCDHGRWLTHGRSIYLHNFQEMGLKITDYCEDGALCDAIRRYYTLLRMSFERSPIFKIYETPNSQIYRSAQLQVMNAQSMPGQPIPIQPPQPVGMVVMLQRKCPHCGAQNQIQANFDEGAPPVPGASPFPKDNIYICPKCNKGDDISEHRKRIEAEHGRNIL